MGSELHRETIEPPRITTKLMTIAVLMCSFLTMVTDKVTVGSLSLEAKNELCEVFLESLENRELPENEEIAAVLVDHLATAAGDSDIAFQDFEKEYLLRTVEILARRLPTVSRFGDNVEARDVALKLAKLEIDHALRKMEFVERPSRAEYESIIKQGESLGQALYQALLSVGDGLISENTAREWTTQYLDKRQGFIDNGSSPAFKKPLSDAQLRLVAERIAANVSDRGPELLRRLHEGRGASKEAIIQWWLLDLTTRAPVIEMPYHSRQITARAENPIAWKPSSSLRSARREYTAYEAIQDEKDFYQAREERQKWYEQVEAEGEHIKLMRSMDLGKVEQLINPADEMISWAEKVPEARSERTIILEEPCHVRPVTQEPEIEPKSGSRMMASEQGGGGSPTFVGETSHSRRLLGALVIGAVCLIIAVYVGWRYAQGRGARTLELLIVLCLVSSALGQTSEHASASTHDLEGISIIKESLDGQPPGVQEYALSRLTQCVERFGAHTKFDGKWARVSQAIGDQIRDYPPAGGMAQELAIMRRISYLFDLGAEYLAGEEYGLDTAFVRRLLSEAAVSQLSALSEEYSFATQELLTAAVEDRVHYLTDKLQNPLFFPVSSETSLHAKLAQASNIHLRPYIQYLIDQKRSYLAQRSDLPDEADRQLFDAAFVSSIAETAINKLVRACRPPMSLETAALKEAEDELLAHPTNKPPETNGAQHTNAEQQRNLRVKENMDFLFFSLTWPFKLNAQKPNSVSMGKGGGAYDCVKLRGVSSERQ